MANNERKVEEMLRTLYEQNEQYHNTKERVVWLSGVIYFIFSSAVLAWIPNSENTVVQGQKPIITIFLILIFVLASVFILRQTGEKTISSTRNTKFLALIEHFDDSNYRNYKALKDTASFKARFGQRFYDFVTQGWSGHLVFGAAYTFFLAQLILLYEHKSWTELCVHRWFVVPYALPAASTLDFVIRIIIRFIGWILLPIKKVAR